MILLCLAFSSHDLFPFEIYNAGIFASLPMLGIVTGEGDSYTASYTPLPCAAGFVVWVVALQLTCVALRQCRSESLYCILCAIATSCRIAKRLCSVIRLEELFTSEGPSYTASYAPLPRAAGLAV